MDDCRLPPYARHHYKHAVTLEGTTQDVAESLHEDLHAAIREVQGLTVAGAIGAALCVFMPVLDRLRIELAEVLSQRDRALRAHMETIRERDYLSHETNQARVELATTKAAIERVERYLDGAQGHRSANQMDTPSWIGSVRAALDAPETPGDADA